MTEKDNKKPAHEVLLLRIGYHYPSNEDRTEAILSELGTILNTMVIPADKIPKIKRKLMNIFASTSPTGIPAKNIDAFRCLIAHFQGEYPE